MQKIKKFEWSDILSVGYNNIDLHHKKLLYIINDFAALLKLPLEEYKVKVGKTLKNLSAYTIYHFSEEEKIMKKYAYPGFERHAELHALFVNKLNADIIPIASGEPEKGVEFYNFLGEWLVKHIGVEDKKWSEFLHSKHPEAEI